MRLKNKNKGGFVGPVSCLLLLTIVALGVVCPQVSGAHAAESVCTERDSDGTITPCNQYRTTDSGGKEFGFNIKEMQEDITEGAGNSDKNFGFDIKTGIDDEYYFEGTDLEDGMGYSKFVPTFQWAEFIQLTTDPESKDINMTVEDPTKGAFTSAAINFKVMTNNAGGFGVFVYAESEKARNLSSTNGSNEAVIAPIATDATKDAFAAKTWGYSITKATEEATNFHPVKVIGETAAAFTQETASAGTELKLTCGTKVDVSLPADTYQTEVVVSAVAPFSASLIGQ